MSRIFEPSRGVSYRSCAKVILVGEHGVVYGRPAIGVGIDRGASARGTIANDNQSLLHFRDRSFTANAKSEHPLERAFHALLGARTAPPVNVYSYAEVEPGAGLGSSAAVGTAVAKVVAALAGETDDPDGAILERTAAWEGVFHGNASGIDAALSLYGGCLWFSRQTGPENLVLGTDIGLCVGDSGTAKATSEMVEAVARMRRRNPAVVEKCFDGIHSLVGNASIAIRGGDLRSLGKLMDLNHMLLSSLMLSTEELEDLCRTAREAGAFGAKLSGSGGGGIAIALVPADDQGLRERILQAWSDAGYKAFFTRVSANQGNEP